MTDVVTILVLPNGESVYKDFPVVGKPGWWKVTDFRTGKPVKPLIRCNCGHVSGINTHSVHADGRVTPSYFHAKKGQHPQGTDDGCGWHVYIKLDGWDMGEMP